MGVVVEFVIGAKFTRHRSTVLSVVVTVIEVTVDW